MNGTLPTILSVLNRADVDRIEGLKTFKLLLKDSQFISSVFWTLTLDSKFMLFYAVSQTH